jgi:photosystem II stability/assembly factor-like uncharacterized protein
MWIKKILFGIVFMLFANCSVFAQSGWVWQNPTPGLGSTNYSTFFINENTGWVSSTGTISITTNAGTSWTKQYETNLYAIFSLHFRDSQNGYACGPYGRFFYTTNGGINWQAKIVTDTSQNYTCVYFRNSMTGYICDRMGVMRKTTNGGTNWTGYNISSPQSAIPVYMEFFNENEGVLYTSNVFFNSTGGGYAGLYKTTNGGLNWSYSIRASLTSRNAYFLDMQTGWICAKDTIFKTTNGGATLTRTPVPGQNASINFINSQTGYSCADTGRIYKTIDGGNSWSLQNTNYIDDLYSISTTENLCLAVGRIGGIVRTTNAGSNWLSTPHSFSREPVMSIKAFNSSDIVSINYRNFVTSYDGGVSWDVYETPFYGNLFMHFINAVTGWVCPYGGGIFRTSNRGLVWDNRSIQFAGLINNIFFINAQTGWATTDNGIYKTTNTGINWTNYVDPNFFFDYDEICFVNDLTGWVTLSAANLSIVKTTNGGLNWVNQNTSEWYITAMKFLNAQTGWISTGTGVRRTTNGGVTWDSLSNIIDINDMEFINSLTGWVVVSPLPSNISGKIYHTSNGGVDWTVQYSAAYNNFRSISFINENTGWAVGSNGAILKTTTGGNVFISQTSTEIPDKFSLQQNYPNPFNPSTNIKFDIRKSGRAELKVYDILGNEIETLVNEPLTTGSYEVSFNGSHLASGIYFYVLKTGDFIESKKMLLVK